MKKSIGVVLRKITGSGERRQFGHEGALDISRYGLHPILSQCAGRWEYCMAACVPAPSRLNYQHDSAFLLRRQYLSRKTGINTGDMGEMANG